MGFPVPIPNLQEWFLVFTIPVPIYGNGFLYFPLPSRTPGFFFWFSRFCPKKNKKSDSRSCLPRCVVCRVLPGSPLWSFRTDLTTGACRGSYFSSKSLEQVDILLGIFLVEIDSLNCSWKVQFDVESWKLTKVKCWKSKFPVSYLMIGYRPSRAQLSIYPKYLAK